MGARPDAREEEGCGRLVRQHDGPFPARGHAGVPSRGAETPGERREVSVPGRRASEAGYQNGVDHCLSLCATLPRYPFETAEDATNRKVTCWNEDEVVVRTVAATMARRRPHCGTRPNSALAVGRAPWAVAGAIPCAVKPGRRPSVRQSLDRSCAAVFLFLQLRACAVGAAATEHVRPPGLGAALCRAQRARRGTALRVALLPADPHRRRGALPAVLRVDWPQAQFQGPARGVGRDPALHPVLRRQLLCHRERGPSKRVLVSASFRS